MLNIVKVQFYHVFYVVFGYALLAKTGLPRHNNILSREPVAAASFATILHSLPIFLPFLASGKGTLAGQADFGGQVLLFDVFQFILRR